MTVQFNKKQGERLLSLLSFFARLFPEVMKAFVVLCLCDGAVLQECIEQNLLFQIKPVVFLLECEFFPVLYDVHSRGISRVIS